MDGEIQKCRRDQILQDDQVKSVESYTDKRPLNFYVSVSPMLAADQTDLSFLLPQQNGCGVSFTTSSRYVRAARTYFKMDLLKHFL